ncbi:MAG: C1 family peptidase [Bacteroidota bacterium]|nr:C1 family peptidase [Bacteroidota bacterium]
MQNFKLLITIALGILITHAGLAQVDKGKYEKRKAGFYTNEIQPALHPKKEKQIFKSFIYDVSSKNLPSEKESFEYFWHNTPESQGSTGTCWCYAATSFMESEIQRISGKQVQLSEMYVTYWDYVERAKLFVEKRGDVYFNHGSEANAVPLRMQQYGTVPLNAYPGKVKNAKFHNHGVVMDEMKAYLAKVKENNNWNSEEVILTIKAIMNHYMGTPPQEFIVDGKKYTPKTYMSEYLKFDANNYQSVMSTMSAPYYEESELVEADNWYHGDNYYNVPIDDFMDIIDNAVKKGYTICICGDVSEPGHNSFKEVSMIPDFDIPSKYINQSARELRLKNKSTTDDHCIHLIGHKKIKGEQWYLIKDSGAGGFNGPNKGYRFFHENYIKLKMMNIMLHKDVVKK